MVRPPPNYLRAESKGSTLSNSSEREEVLSFVWWNTSLAPGKRSQSTEEEQQVALALVQMLITELGVDFIALGEVSAREAEIFRKIAEADGFSLLEGFAPSGRSRFSMLFIYDSTRLQVGSPMTIESRQGDRTLRVAQRLDILISGAEHPLHVLASHWPSRIHMAKNSPDRSLLGIRLRDAVDELLSLYTDSGSLHAPNVILLGDYNDEPFDNSLSEHLRSTRDRNLVRKKTDLLYNPFWRYLGAPCGNSEDNAWTLGGTHYHSKGNITRWRLFDQMIFSRSFLQDGEWKLDEKHTQFVDLPNYSKMLDNGKQRFDHAPILGVLRRVKK